MAKRRQGTVLRAVIGAVFALGLLTLPRGASVSGAPDWQVFRHPSQGFSINYPRGWESLSGTGQASFVAIGPAIAGVPGVRMIVVVVSAVLPRGATLEDAESSMQANLARMGQPANVLRHDRFSLRGTPAFLVYLHRKNPQGVELYQMAMILMHRGQGFGVVGSTAAASPSLTEDTRLLQSILLTFRPLK